MSRETRYAIDSLTARGERLFGWGWILVPGRRVDRVSIQFMGVDTVSLECPLSGERTDVVEALGCQGESVSGFLIVGALHGLLPSALSAPRSAVMRVETDDGGVLERNLDGFPEAFLNEKLPPLQKSRQLTRLTRAKLQRDGLRATAASIGSYLRRVWERRERPPLTLDGGVVVVLDHAMGGGTNRYRAGLVKRLEADGKHVLVVTPELSTLSYKLEDACGGSESCSELPDLMERLVQLQPAEVHVNSLVSYDDPEAVTRSLLGMPSHTRIHFYLHDYFSLCPSWTLTDDRSRFCGVPALARCLECLPRCPAMFKSFYPEDLNIPRWRGHWHAFLQRCDRITAFSEDTRILFGRAYPALLDKIDVAPHQVDYLPPPRPIPYVEDGIVRVGVLGHLDKAKGAGMLAEIIARADRLGLPLEFVVFGSMDRAPSSPRLNLHGKYSPDQLPELFAHYNITICFLPSVCSETFSYVAAEIMHFDMPLAVFDIGAPRERLARYHSGRVIARMDAAEAASTLMEFGRQEVRKRVVGSTNGIGFS